MRSSSQDLEVFIITITWEFLNTTLDSLLYQKDNDFSLTIIDNGSDININQIYTHNERYRIIRFEENDQFGIWEKLPTLTTKKWMMIFHDDDLLHPTYISSAFKILNKFPSVNVIGCYTKSFKTSTHSLNWKLKNSLKHLYLKNEKN